MKVQVVTLHCKRGITTLGGGTFHSFSEGEVYADLHYIWRDGQHVVNYSDPATGKRHGVSLPAHDIAQVNTVL